jgi:hypothetical protein
MKIILTIMCIATLSFASTQTRYSTDNFELLEWNSYKEIYENSVLYEGKYVFQFYDDYTRFNIIGKEHLDWTVTNIDITEDMIMFTGLDGALTEYIFMIDYKNQLIKMICDLEGRSVLMMYNIISTKTYE